MTKNEKDRLKRKLEWGLAGAIATQELPPDWRKAGDVPMDSESNRENTKLSLFLTANSIETFEVQFYNLNGSFKLLTQDPIDPNKADQTLTDAVEDWWPKYRCCLVDYWNLCHPDNHLNYPEKWGCGDDQS